jgi:membrane protease YdiL (CAAX protease family)
LARIEQQAQGAEQPPFWRRNATQAALVFLAIWFACVVFLAIAGGNFLFPISSLVLFGVVLTGMIVFLTRKTGAPEVPVALPKRESVVLLLYVLVYALLIFGPMSGMLKSSLPPGRAQELVMLGYKLLVHVAIPIGLIHLAGGHVRGILDVGLRRRGVLPVLIIVSAFMIVAVALLNSIFEQLGASGLSTLAIVGWIAITWLWYTLEVGVTEEFLFRGLLQSRLTAWLQSGPMAIIATSVLFALAHVPTFYLRGGEEIAKQAGSLPQIIALAVASLAPISIMLGTLWYRTRSFALVVLVHGAIDTMPGVEEMIRLWG